MASIESLNKQVGKILTSHMNQKVTETREHLNKWNESIDEVRAEANKQCQRVIKLPKYKDWNLNFMTQ